MLLVRSLSDNMPWMTVETNALNPSESRLACRPTVHAPHAWHRWSTDYAHMRIARARGLVGRVSTTRAPLTPP